MISFVLGRRLGRRRNSDCFQAGQWDLAQDLKADHLKIRLIDDHLNTKKELQIN